ncbi:hypothetical protein IMSAGC007_02175 [Lachnospiraceae bacterium]|nr:hypothetical protein IMSAGC007_02175 [Lachnospiraceae bacterium]
MQRSLPIRSQTCLKIPPQIHWRKRWPPQIQMQTHSRIYLQPLPQIHWRKYWPPQIQTQPHSQICLQFLSQIHSQMQSHSRIQTQSRSQIQTQSRSRVQTQSHSRMQTQSRSRMQTQSRSRVQTQSRSRMQTQSRSRIQTQIPSPIQYPHCSFRDLPHRLTLLFQRFLRQIVHHQKSGCHFHCSHCLLSAGETQTRYAIHSPSRLTLNPPVQRCHFPPQIPHLRRSLLRQRQGPPCQPPLKLCSLYSFFYDSSYFHTLLQNTCSLLLIIE